MDDHPVLVEVFSDYREGLFDCREGLRMETHERVGRSHCSGAWEEQEKRHEDLH